MFGAALALLPGPAAPDVTSRAFVGLCAADWREFAPALGPIVREPELAAENPQGVAVFAIRGARMHAMGIALADGITWCILWAGPVEGDPS